MSAEENVGRKWDKKQTGKKNRPDTTYSLDDKYLGHALIVNNVTYMEGSKKDVDALNKAYTKMGFAVHIRNDCNENDMNEIETEMMNGKNHENSSCFLLTIITHGDDKGGLMIARETEGSPDVVGWNVEEIVEGLNGVTALLGKPKILIIYACRGAPQGPGDEGSKYLQLLAKSLSKFYDRHSIDRIFTYVRRQISPKEQIVTIQEEVDGKTQEVNKKVRQCIEDRSSLTFVLDFSEFDKPDEDEEVEPLQWISEPGEGDRETKSPERKKPCMQMGAQQSGAYGMPEDDVHSRKERELTEQQILGLADNIVTEELFECLAAQLKQKHARKHLTNHTREINVAASGMLNEWKRSKENEIQQWNDLYEALDHEKLRAFRKILME